MMKTTRDFLFALAVLPISALAHGPTPQKVIETIEIQAPPDKVWSLVKEFGGIAQWHPMVAECKSTGDNSPGAERTLTLKAGGQIIESLDEFDAHRLLGYRLSKENVKAFPVSFYSATIEIKPAGDQNTTVEWLSRFYRGDTSNFPPEDLNDEAATAAMTEFFKSGLEGLKKAAETSK